MHVELPTHWQSGVIIVGAWTAGLQVSLGDSPDDVAASVVGPAARTHAEQVRGHVLACSLRPMGGPFADELPAGWLDFAREVPPQPDALMSVVPIGPGDPALVVTSAVSSHAELVDPGSRGSS